MDDTERWKAIRALFDETVELDGAARTARLAAIRAESPTVAADLESLLEWDARPFGLDEGAPFCAPKRDDAASLVGCELGPWRVIGIIGRGGMGVVYRAERADAAFRMAAAVKVVRSGGLGDEVLRRFVQERETLAALDHPHIARVLDAGATPKGEPYLVMELVDGVPIDRYCDEHQLSIEARLDLFRRVCDAVRYAHQALVVHRDIKPDNILVTRDGTAKLLDFGVAKLLTQDDTTTAAPDDLATTWLLTPEYASPEQIHGRAVTTTTDVYSLGVLLSVLLTGRRPYVLTGRTASALRDELDGLSRDSPSVAALAGPDAAERAAARGSTPAGLSARLAGDLDAIVGKALEAAPARRYGSVDQLAADLERHRTLQPIDARVHDLRYVLGRLARRHRTALSFAGVAGLLILVAMATIVWQARLAAEARARAERRFADVRRLSQSMLFGVHDAIVNVPGTTAARSLMIRTAISYLDSLAKEAADDRTLQRELAAAYVKVGDAQGHPTSANLGDSAGARESYRRAIGVAESLLAVGPDPEATRTLARAHRQLADVLAWGGDRQGALGHAELSRRLYLELGAGPGASIDDRLQAAVSDIKLGDLLGNPNLPNLERRREASLRYEASLASIRTLVADAPTHQGVRRYYGLVFERLGALAEAQHEWDAAERAYRESFAARAALAADVRLHNDIQRDLAVAYEKLGNVQRARTDRAAAIDSYRGALAQFMRLAESDPSNAIAARSASISREKLAEALIASGGAAEAEGLFRTALATLRTLGERDPDNIPARCDRRRVASRLATLLLSRPASAANRRDACAFWRESDAVARELRARGAEGCVTPRDFDDLRDALRRCGG